MADYSTTTNLAVVSVVFMGALVGVFATKTSGFGVFTTGIVIAILVLFASTIGFIFKDSLAPDSFQKILFTALGFAGGLFTAKASQSGTS